MSLFHIVFALVVLARLAELVHANRNTRRLLADGAVEIGRGQYPYIVAFHTLWLAALLVFVPGGAPADPYWLAIFATLVVFRVWVIASLGRFWTTRIISKSDAPLVRRGPYRFIRHPNYLVVALEIPVLPLAFGAWQIAAIFGFANLALLAWRISLEDPALALRR